MPLYKVQHELETSWRAAEKSRSLTVEGDAAAVVPPGAVVDDNRRMGRVACQSGHSVSKVHEVVDANADYRKMDSPSSPRRRGSRMGCSNALSWIPAFAGMTDIGDSTSSSQPRSAENFPAQESRAREIATKAHALQSVAQNIMRRICETPPHDVHNPWLVVAARLGTGLSTGGIERLLQVSDSKSAATLLEQLAGATDAELSEVRDFLKDESAQARRARALVEYWKAEAQDVDTAPLGIAAVGKSTSDQDTILRQQLKDNVTAMQLVWGLEPEAAAIAAQRRLAQATDAVEFCCDAIAETFGQALGSKIRRSVDQESIVHGIASLHSDGMIDTSLENSPFIEARRDELMNHMIDQCMRIKAGDMRVRAENSEELREIGEALKESAIGDSALDEVWAALLRRYGDCAARSGEDAFELARRVASNLAAPDAFESVMGKLTHEYSQERKAFLEDLCVFAGEWQQRIVHERTISDVRCRRESALGQGVFKISAQSIQALRCHVRKTFPNEALGFLVTDGTLDYFISAPSSAPDDSAANQALLSSHDAARLSAFMRRHELHLLAHVHSHPGESPLISSRDIRALAPLLAIQPKMRVFIAGVNANGDNRVFDMASFAVSVAEGTIEEDLIEVG